MNLTDKMAYVRGMVDGMELDLTSTKEGKVLGQLLDVMQDLTAYVTDLQTDFVPSGSSVGTPSGPTRSRIESPASSRENWRVVSPAI